MNRSFFLFCLALLSLLDPSKFLGAGITGTTPSTTPIHDNGPPNHTTGQVNGFEITHWRETDEFTLNKAARFDGVKFWDFEVNGSFAGLVTWEIYSNSASNTPATLLYSGTSSNLAHIATGFVYFGFLEFANTFDVTPLALSAGTYWIVLHNGPLSNNAGQNVFWETSSSSGTIPSRNDIAPFLGVWLNNVPSSELSFQLHGTLAPDVTAFDLDTGAPRIVFATISGENYRVEYSDSLAAGSWVTLPGAETLTGTGGEVSISDLQPNARNLSRRFYRVVLL